MSTGRDNECAFAGVGDGSLPLDNGSRLTPREVDILRLIGAGLRNREIGERLYLSVHTVEYNATRLYQKLGVRNRTEAGLVAVRLGLLGTTPGSRFSEPGDLREPKMPAARHDASLQSIKAGRSVAVMRGLLSWFTNRWSGIRAGLLGAGLLVVLSSGAIAAGRLDVDERLLGYRLDKRVFGHSPEYHCISLTPQPTLEAPLSPIRPTPQPPVQVEVVGANQTTSAQAGELCFTSSERMWLHLGRDPDRPYCAATTTTPKSYEDISWIPHGEPLPSSGIQCFESRGDALRQFDLSWP